MHCKSWLTLGLFCSSTLALPSPKPSDVPEAASDDVHEAYDQLAALAQVAEDSTKAGLHEDGDLAGRGAAQKCTLKNLRIRREW